MAWVLRSLNCGRRSAQLACGLAARAVPRIWSEEIREKEKSRQARAGQVVSAYIPFFSYYPYFFQTQNWHYLPECKSVRL
jgi:hypothetical protein